MRVGRSEEKQNSGIQIKLWWRKIILNNLTKSKPMTTAPSLLPYPLHHSSFSFSVSLPPSTSLPLLIICLLFFGFFFFLSREIRFGEHEYFLVWSHEFLCIWCFLPNSWTIRIVDLACNVVCCPLVDRLHQWKALLSRHAPLPLWLPFYSKGFLRVKLLYCSSYCIHPSESHFG